MDLCAHLCLVTVCTGFVVYMRVMSANKLSFSVIACSGGSFPTNVDESLNLSF